MATSKNRFASGDIESIIDFNLAVLLLIQELVLQRHITLVSWETPTLRTRVRHQIQPPKTSLTPSNTVLKPSNQTELPTSTNTYPTIIFSPTPVTPLVLNARAASSHCC